MCMLYVHVVYPIHTNTCALTHLLLYIQGPAQSCSLRGLLHNLPACAHLRPLWASSPVGLFSRTSVHSVFILQLFQAQKHFRITALRSQKTCKSIELNCVWDFCLFVCLCLCFESGSCYVAQANLGLSILPPQPPESWD
jgi:hypothetical protein